MVHTPARAPGGPDGGLVATPHRPAQPPLDPGVPCTMAGCVSPRGYRGVHHEARTRVMPASHPPMPGDPPCLGVRPCLYSAREPCQPRPPCGRAPQGVSSQLLASAEETAHGRDPHVRTLCRDSL